MPFLRTYAPPQVSEMETLEVLLGKHNASTKSTSKIPTLDELSDEDRAKVHLVELGKRCEAIPGDPYGLYPSWAGNVGHPLDARMFDVMEPIFQSIRETTMLKTATIASIRHLLSKVPAINTKDLAGELSDHNEYKLLKDTAEETVVSFRLGSNTVRLMHAKDLDKDTKDSYNKSNRAKHAKSKIDEILDEPSMPVEVQKLLMASMMRERATKLVKAEARPCQYGKGFFETLRSDAREHYWLGMDRSQRESYRVEASRQPDPDTEEYLTIIKANWKPAWQNGRYDTDYFRRYLADQVSAKQIWELVEEDIFIVTDKHRRVVFASIERLAQLLFGRDISGLLERALDNWSFFTPLPLPESTRHVVDRYIRKLHPVLNPETASVEKLPMAKMAIAHYGCWSQKGDRNARRVQQTLDSTFMRCAAQSNSRSLFKKLCSSVFAKASEMIRFLVETLDPEYYRECLDIVSQLPEDERVKFTDQDFVSLFALGVNPYTQRHRDSNDVSGGLAGLITLGSYEGGHLCLPQLGLKVRYEPGATAIIRGDRMEHLVQDYTPPRYFLVGTIHESSKRYAWRKLGRDGSAGERHSLLGEDEDEGNALGTTCVNESTDDDDEGEMHWNNEKIHGPAVLDHGAESDGSSDTHTQNSVFP